MTQIQLLSDHAINQIAAGEVISSPISCIKELIENSLDANAKRIDVSIENGGLDLIEVKDDGNGIPKEQLPKAILRHATSKLKTIDDLEKIYTMGFRGEALAAIASVSKLSIQTCCEGDLAGVKLSTVGGKNVDIKDAAPFQGCIIQIKELFFNTPVRKKFQKNKTALVQEASALLRSLALSRLDVAFSLQVNGKMIFQTSSSSHSTLQETFSLRAMHLFSEEFIEKSLFIEGKVNDMEVFGLISKPTLTRPSRSAQKIFLNHRLIQSSVIIDAVEKSFATSIPSDRFPLFCLHIKLNANAYDVNVHPQKRFIRIKDEAVLRSFIETQIQKKLFQKTKKLSTTTSTSIYSFSAPSLSIDQFAAEEMGFQMQILAHFREYCLIDATSIPQIEKEGWMLANVRNIWLKKNGDNQAHCSAQPLLFPMHLELNFEERQYVESHMNRLQEFGFDLSLGPDGNYLLQALPSILNEKEVIDFITDLTKAKIKLNYQNISKIASQVKSFSLEEKRELIIDAIRDVELQSIDGKSNFCFIGKTELDTIFNQYAI